MAVATSPIPRVELAAVPTPLLKLERLSREGHLHAYRHTGFWQSMDTLRDVRYLNDLWAGDRAPWKVWKGQS